MFKNIKTRVVIVVLTLTLGVILIIGGLAPPLNEKVASIVFTFGVTFTASAVISIVLLAAGFFDLVESAKELASTIGDKLGMPCAQRFSLVESANAVGLSMTYLSRERALESSGFHKFIDGEKDQLFIVGSSLLGLLQDRHFSHVVDTIRTKISSGVEVRFMLTHPLFADFRAAQEGRNPREIGEEIIKSLRIISEMWQKNKGLTSVYLYRGTPSCFGICATEAMLVNPYPYGRQAYESPCFELKAESAAYNLYRQAHFQTQVGGKIDKIMPTDDIIGKLETRIAMYADKVQEFEAIDSQANVYTEVSTKKAIGDDFSKITD